MEFVQEIWDFFQTGILRGGMYSLMAVGLTLVFGVMNIANFAHGEFYMLGAFFGYFAYSWGYGPIVSIMVAGLGVFVVAGITERTLFVALRKRSKRQWLMNTFLLTLGISIILQNGAKLIWGAKYRGVSQMWTDTKWVSHIGLSPETMKGFVKSIQAWGFSPDRLAGFFIAMVTIALFVLFLNKTNTGRAIRAVSQDETGASLVGINLGFIHTLVFALSGLLAGIAGASLLSISPAFPFMGTMPLYKSWFVLILVGMGNIGGSIVGGLILVLLETFATMYMSGWLDDMSSWLGDKADWLGVMTEWLGSGSQDFISVSVIILILLIKPNGIFGKTVKSASE